MANAALVIDNLADSGTVTASSQALTMPAATLQDPHPSNRWRSLVSTAFIVLDNRALVTADTSALFGMTCGRNSTVRLRRSSLDASGAAGDVLDTGTIVNGAASFDVSYGSFLYRSSAPQAWRYTRIDISDPDASYVEAGIILDGLSEAFTYNFNPGGSIQHIDRSRLAQASSGQTLSWDDNTFRRVDLAFDWVTAAQRYGVIERMDRVKGKHRNILLMTDTASSNLPRASLYGLLSDITPVGFTAFPDIFQKQLRLDERI
jgi:hypothetical protein